MPKAALLSAEVVSKASKGISGFEDKAKRGAKGITGSTSVHIFFIRKIIG